MDQQPDSSEKKERFELQDGDWNNEQYPLPQQRVGSGPSSDESEPPPDHLSLYPLPQQRVQSDGSGLGCDQGSDSGSDLSTEEVPNI